jgi:hypothetical protein
MAQAAPADIPAAGASAIEDRDMSRERNDTPRPRRRLSPDEHRLWNGIVRSVSPLRRRPPVPPPVEIVAAGDEPAPPARRRAEPAPARQAATKPVPKLVPKPAPPLAPLDRRQKQRLARGAEPIPARAACSNAKSRSGCGCLNSAVSCSRSRTPTRPTAAAVRSMCGCGGHAAARMRGITNPARLRQ